MAAKTSASGRLGQKYGRTTQDRTAKHRQTNLTTSPTKSHGSR